MSRDSWVFWLPWCVGVMAILATVVIMLGAWLELRRERRDGDPAWSEPGGCAPGDLSPEVPPQAGPDGRREIFDWAEAPRLVYLVRPGSRS